jgi:predicted PurR-regulated permease PerM/pterin-4a-carbinolamine dehydratase
MQPGFWWRASLAGALAIMLGIGALYGLRALGRPLALLILALMVASALGPLVGLIDRFLPRIVAIAVVYLAFPGVLALIGYLAAPSFVSQLDNVSSRIPELVNQLQPLLTRLGNLAPSNLLSTLASDLSAFASSLVSVPLTIANSLVDFVAILFISIYALLEAEDMRKFVLSLVPPQQQGALGNLLHHMVWEMGGYLRGAFLDGLIIGLTTYVGLLLIGVDFPLILGLIAGLLEIVPAVGPIIAAIPVLLVSLLQSPTTALISLIFMLAIHQFEGNIVFPNVMRSQTSISPLLVLVGLLSGYAGGGILGALTAIPLVAVGRVFILDVIAPAIRRETGAPEPKEENGKNERVKPRIERFKRCNPEITNSEESTMKLANESCKLNIVALSPEEIGPLASQVPNWTRKDQTIEREFQFEDFDEAMDFVDDVADVAAEENHHPDIFISYNLVRLTLSTHKVGGLSRNDFILAAKIDELIGDEE